MGKKKIKVEGNGEEEERQDPEVVECHGKGVVQRYISGKP